MNKLGALQKQAEKGFWITCPGFVQSITVAREKGILFESLNVKAPYELNL